MKLYLKPEDDLQFFSRGVNKKNVLFFQTIITVLWPPSLKIGGVEGLLICYRSETPPVGIC